MVAQYAPYAIWDSGEKYFPCTFEYFLNNMDGYVCPGDKSPRPLSNVLELVKTLSLPFNKTSGCWITTKPYFTDPVETKPWFSGMKPTEWPIYFHAYHQIDNVWDVQYRVFYAYNLGKYQCVSFGLKSYCLGTRRWFDNHIVDEENMSIRFVNGKPTYVVYNFHEWTKVIPWNEVPEIYQNTHPVAYIASGSHGMWWKKGKWIYKNIKAAGVLMDTIEDNNDAKGPTWQTWNNLVELSLNEAWFKYPTVQWGQGPFGDSACDALFDYERTTAVRIHKYDHTV